MSKESIQEKSAYGSQTCENHTEAVRFRASYSVEIDKNGEGDKIELYFSSLMCYYVIEIKILFGIILK